MEIYWYTWHKLKQHLFFNVNPSVNLDCLKHLNPHKKYHVYSQFKKIKKHPKIQYPTIALHYLLQLLNGLPLKRKKTPKQNQKQTKQQQQNFLQTKNNPKFIRISQQSKFLPAKRWSVGWNRTSFQGQALNLFLNKMVCISKLLPVLLDTLAPRNDGTTVLLSESMPKRPSGSARQNAAGNR